MYVHDFKTEFESIFTNLKTLENIQLHSSLSAETILLHTKMVNCSIQCMQQNEWKWERIFTLGEWGWTDLQWLVWTRTRALPLLERMCVHPGMSNTHMLLGLDLVGRPGWLFEEVTLTGGFPWDGLMGRGCKQWEKVLTAVKHLLAHDCDPPEPRSHSAKFRMQRIN